MEGTFYTTLCFRQSKQTYYRQAEMINVTGKANKMQKVINKMSKNGEKW